MTIYKAGDTWHDSDSSPGVAACGVTIPHGADRVKIGHDGKKYLPEPPLCPVCFKLRAGTKISVDITSESFTPAVWSDFVREEADRISRARRKSTPVLPY